MSKVDDIELFTRVVKAGGLAAAGRQIGLSPAAMTARINSLESRYNTRLLNRSTRSMSMTDAGQRFYDGCLRVLEELYAAEAALQDQTAALSGQLRITATSDFGRQYVASAIAEFSGLHPALSITLHLSDGVSNLSEQGFDLGIRFGNLPDSNMISKPLAHNHRVLCASPQYFKQRGIPGKPEDLLSHSCLVMDRLGEPLNEWWFLCKGRKESIKVNGLLTSNDGALIRQWALAGLGVALKSYWDVKKDIDSGALHTVLDDEIQGFDMKDTEQVGLQMIYLSRRYMPRQVQAFMAFFSQAIQQLAPAVN